MNITTLIKRPIITEKSLATTKNNNYTFAVDRHATKTQIKQAIKQLFGVDVVNVRTSIKKAVSISTGKKRMPGQTPVTKKAIVEIKAGQSIKVFETKG